MVNSKIIMLLVIAVGVWQGLALKKRHEALKEEQNRQVVQTAQAATHFFSGLRQKEDDLMATWVGAVDAYLTDAATLDVSGSYSAEIAGPGVVGSYHAEVAGPGVVGVGRFTGPFAAPFKGIFQGIFGGALTGSATAQGGKVSTRKEQAEKGVENMPLLFLTKSGHEENRKIHGKYNRQSNEEYHENEERKNNRSGNEKPTASNALYRTSPAGSAAGLAVGDVPVPVAFARALVMRHQKAVDASRDNTPTRDAATNVYARKTHPAAARPLDPAQPRTLD